MNQLSATPATSILVLATAASVLGLFFAFLLQYGMAVLPCELCHWQRWPHAAAVTIGIVGISYGGRAVRPALGLLGLVLLVGAGIAAYHIGVENGWWAGTAACAGGDVAGQPQSMAEMRERLAGPPSPRCDAPAWTFAGVSLADINFVYSLAVGLICAVRAAMGGRR